MTFQNCELIFGLVCPVGGNYRKVKNELAKLLTLYRYNVREIRLSDILAEAHGSLALTTQLAQTPEYLRIKSHMACGNELREKTKTAEFLALAAISKINQQRHRTPSTGSSEPSPRQAHILLTLKRPGEVDLLRRICGPGSFLTGAQASKRERLDYLETEYGMPTETRRRSFNSITKIATLSVNKRVRRFTSPTSL